MDAVLKLEIFECAVYFSHLQASATIDRENASRRVREIAIMYLSLRGRINARIQ